MRGLSASLFPAVFLVAVTAVHFSQVQSATVVVSPEVAGQLYGGCQSQDNGTTNKDWCAGCGGSYTTTTGCTGSQDIDWNSTCGNGGSTCKIPIWVGCGS